MELTRRSVVAGGLVCAGLFCFYLLAAFFHPFGFDTWMVKEALVRVFFHSLKNLFTSMLFQPWFWIAIAGTMLLERLFPAKPNQPLFGVSFVQDIVWFFYETILRTIILVSYVKLLTVIHAKAFPFLTISAITNWPDWVRFAIGILSLDFMYWVQHYVNHRVPVLWSFHAVHHSQTHLNFFTDFRYHIVEYIVRNTFIVVPFLILQVDAPKIVWFAIILQWYTRFYHGNIRTNLGVLRHVLVTPQSHRIHHSLEPRHHGKNFGSVLSIWDQLLGTQYRGYNEYPETGIDDEHFPHEQSTGLKSLLLTPLAQMAYPFQNLHRAYTRRGEAQLPAENVAPASSAHTISKAE